MRLTHVTKIEELVLEFEDGTTIRASKQEVLDAIEKMREAIGAKKELKPTFVPIPSTPFPYPYPTVNPNTSPYVAKPGENPNTQITWGCGASWPFTPFTPIATELQRSLHSFGEHKNDPERN